MKRTGELKRTTPLPRAATPRQRVRVKARNPERQAKEFQRTYGGVDRVEWFKAQPCLVCSVTPSVNAHVGPKGAKGTGYKADACWTVPLCTAHHDEEHQGQQTFEATHHVDLEHVAQVYDARWQQYCATMDTPKTGDENNG